VSAAGDERRRAAWGLALAAALWGGAALGGAAALWGGTGGSEGEAAGEGGLPPPLEAWASAEVLRPGWPAARLARDGGGPLRAEGGALDPEARAALEEALAAPPEALEWREVHGEEGLRRLGLSEAAIVLRVAGAGAWRVGAEEERRATWVLPLTEEGVGAAPWRAARVRGRLRRALDRPAAEWRDRALAPLPGPLLEARLTRVQGGAEEEVWRLRRAAAEAPWALASPAGLPLDAAQAQAAAFTLQGLRVERLEATPRLETHRLHLRAAGGEARVGLWASAGGLWGARGGEWGPLPSHVSAHVPLRLESLLSRRLYELPAEGVREAEWRAASGEGWRLWRGAAGWRRARWAAGGAEGPPEELPAEAAARLSAALSATAPGVALLPPPGAAPVGALRVTSRAPGDEAARTLRLWRAGARVGVTREWDGLSLWVSEEWARAAQEAP